MPELIEEREGFALWRNRREPQQWTVTGIKRVQRGIFVFGAIPSDLKHGQSFAPLTERQPGDGVSQVARWYSRSRARVIFRRLADEAQAARMLGEKQC